MILLILKKIKTNEIKITHVKIDNKIQNDIVQKTPEEKLVELFNCKNNYNHLINESINIIDNYKIKNNNNNLINIILRTHLRENEFNKCIISILSQTYTNYIIHISYDHDDTYNYIKNFKNYSNVLFYKMYRMSDNNCFFDLYCDEIKKNISDGFIMNMDDDNYFIHSDCLKIINDNLNKNSITIWKFINSNIYIYPSNLNNIKYGEVDNCSIIYHNKIKINLNIMIFMVLITIL